MVYAEFEDAKREIETVIELEGKYTHNILGMILRQVDQQYGTMKANELIDEYDLENYGINKE